MRSVQNIVITCLVVAVLAAIWIPIVFGDIAKDPWVKWVYNYQTLITGFVAAGAAYLTVREMRNSTGQQVAMLQKQLAVQLLPDQRAFKRFYEMIVLLERYRSNLLMSRDSITKKEIFRANKARFFYTLDNLNADLAKFKVQTFVIPPYEVMKAVELQVDFINNEVFFFRNEFKGNEEEFSFFLREHVNFIVFALGIVIDVNKNWVIKMYPDIEQWHV